MDLETFIVQMGRIGFLPRASGWDALLVREKQVVLVGRFGDGSARVTVIEPDRYDGFTPTYWTAEPERALKYLTGGTER